MFDHLKYLLIHSIVNYLILKKSLIKAMLLIAACDIVINYKWTTYNIIFLYFNLCSHFLIVFHTFWMTFLIKMTTRVNNNDLCVKKFLISLNCTHLWLLYDCFYVLHIGSKNKNSIIFYLIHIMILEISIILRLL